MPEPALTPMERIESLSRELLSHYGDGPERELRVAAKLYLVALDQFRRYGGSNWPDLATEYLTIAKRDPEKFERILRANRSDKTARP